MSSDNKRKLYDALSQDYDMGTYEQFCKDIQDETKRKKLYDATSEAYDYGDYAKFSSQLGFGTTAPAPSPPTLVEDVKPEKPAKQPKKQQTWQPTPMQKAFMSHAVQSQLDQYKASTDAMLERSQNTMDYYRGRGGITGAPVKGKMKVNPASGKVEQTYLTPTGTSTTNKAMAEHETRAYNEHVDMTVAGQLRRAGRDLQNLHRKRDARAKAIEEEWAVDYKKNKAPLAAVLAAGTYRPSIEGDQEYRALTAAIHQAEKRVQTLQHENDRQQGKDVGFWRGFGEVVGDIKTWDFGYSGLLDAMTMLDASRPSPKALPKTEAQKAAQQTMLEQTAEAQTAQAAYGQNDSFWNRAGVMTGEMLPFMLDFALMGGSNSGTSAVTRTIDAALLKSLRSAAPKVARNKAAQWTVKALGAMPEDLLYRSPLMTNSVQGMKTASDIIDRKLGDVVVRQDGTYDFSNDKTWGSAIWQGEANAIIENYSEMFGTHLEGVLSLNTLSKIADTFGAKRLSGVLAKASSSELAGIAGTMQKHLNRLGVSDYFGEVGEEYYGQLWRTMLNLDDAYKHNPDGTRTNLFLDGQFHGDIWGGMALSMGLMGAGKYTISAAAYSSMKHRVNKTDARAAEIFTPDVWEGWRDKIDNTLNSDIGAMTESIVTDTSLTPEQRDAAMNYMEASLNLRGFNLSSIARQRGGGQTAEEAAANESYMDGYSATTPQEMNDAKRMLDLQRQRLASSLSDDMVQEYDADPIGALSRTTDPELRRIAADYVNAKQVYDGMIQRVRDDLDGRIAQSDAMIDSRVNRETGMIQPATMKIDDRPIYIVNGTVSMYEDGTGVDTDNSSESIIIRDAETGRIEFAAPAQVLNVGEGIDAEIEKEAARNQIIQEIAQAAANNIDGVLSFSPGDTYSVLDIDGNPEDISILGQTTDENGIPLDGYVDIQYPDGTIQSVATSDLQQWVDAANEKRVAKFAEERATERAAANEAERQADETGLSNPNRDRSLLPDNWGMPYYGFYTTASRYIESERGTGGILYQDEQGNDAIVISAIDNNNYVGYFREYDEQGQPTNRWSAKFQNGTGLRENYRDMMQTAQELLPAGHELTEHTSVSTDGLRNLANQLKHGYELQYDEQGNIITTEVMINMMARENDLGLAEYEPGNIDPARVSSEEYKEAAARLIPYMEALGLSKFNIHWEDGYLYVDHPILRRADTSQQETAPGVPESNEIVLKTGEIAENEGQGVPKVEEFGDGGIIITPDIAMSDEEVAAALAGEESAPSTASEETRPSALSQIPTDEKGDPIYEQAEPGTAWDALLEETEDEQIAQNVIAQEIAEREDALKKLEKQKPKAGLSTREKIQAEKDKKKAMDDIRKSIDHWKRMSSTKQRRQTEADAIRNEEARRRAEERRAQEEQARAEREEAERQEREALNGVPDWSHDTPQDARARGYRRFGPEKVDRQEPVTSVSGKEVEVKFGESELSKGKATLINVSSLQPSHIDGMRNPRHFIDEAQPKERTDAPSREAARKIASNIRPEEITSSVTAYIGAPTVNSRGETIQGNSRAAALRLMYETQPEQAAKYRQYLIDHAADFGLTPEQVEGMVNPVLVNMLDVADDEAIRLGQFVAQDTESGGIERIKPKNAVKKMGNKIRRFTNILLRSSDDEASLSQLVDSNGVDVLKWMAQQGFISDTQYASSFDSKGHLKGEAANDLKGILYQSIFTGGSTRLEEMFNNLPAKAQRAILATAFRDYDSSRADRMVEEIQQSIMAYNDMMYYDAFAQASNIKEATGAMESWKRQYAMDDVTGEPYIPAENFSNFALALAAIYKGGTQRFIQQTFNDLYDTVQGTAQDTLFEEADKTPKPLAEAIKKVLDLEYQPIKKEETNDNGSNGSDAVDLDTPQSETGGPGSDGNAENGERRQEATRTADSRAGTSTDSGSRNDVKPVGKGKFGAIFAAFRGQAKAAWQYLSALKSGQARGVFYRPEIGEIDLVWGEAPTPFSGKGLAHIDRKHVKTLGDFASMEEAIGVIDDVVRNGEFKEDKANTLAIEKDNYRVVIARDEAGNWVLTAFDKDTPAKEKKKRKDAATRGTAGQPNAEARAVASDLSEDKGNALLSDKQEKGVEISLGERISEAEAEVNTNPSEAQKETGNYKKGHVQVGAFDVTIENLKGSKRSGTDEDGKKWETTMTHTYGYIRGTQGVDGDHIDVYLSSDIDGWNGRKVFVVDQYNPDGSFDEHKVMLGFNDKDEAFEAYLSNYEAGWEKGRRLDVTAANLDDFEKWIESSKRKTKAFTEYAGVKVICPVCGKAGIPNYHNHDVVCPQCNSDLSVFRQIDQLSENEKQELSDKFIGEDNQGNPIDHAGKLIVEDVTSIDDITDEDFVNPTRTIGLPKLPNAVSDAIGSKNKRVIIKKNIFGKNHKNHKELTPSESREILRTALYTPSLYGRNQKQTRPYNWILIHLADKSTCVLLEVDNSKENCEIVNWHYLSGETLARKKRQAIKEGGRILTLSENNVAADTHDGLPSDDKGNTLSTDKQTESAESSDGYTIEPRKDTRDNSDIFAVKFEERVSREVFKGQKAIAKKHGGYWSNFGKKGFLFKTREDAEAFANEVIGKDKTQLSEEAPLSIDDMQSAIKSAFEETPTDKEEISSSSEETTAEKKDVNPSGNKLVTDEQYAELLAKMRKKMGGQLNMGVDPEILAIGSMMAVYHIEKGARKFAEYVKAMVADLGEKFPARYLKGFYKAAHEMIEDAAPEIAVEMDSDDVVNTADVASIISGRIDAMATAEMVVEEETAEQEREEAERKLKDERNVRLNPDGSTSETVTEGGVEIEVTKGDFIPGVRRNNGKAEWTGQTEEPKKKKSQKKTVSSQSEQPGLFGGLFDEEATPTDNDIRRNDAVSTERLPSDNRGQSEGNSENPRAQSQGTRQGSERTDRAGEESGAERTRTVRPRLSRLNENERRNTKNNRAERGTDYAPKSEDARIRANIAAIELAQRLIESGEQATPEDMQWLRMFSGWGGLGKAFTNNAYADRIRKLLGDSYQDAVDSRKSAYYTPAAIIDSLWDIAKAMGFQGGTILEGSAGIGNILGLMPEEISERSEIRAVEVDSTTGSILSLLYPDAQVDIQGFEETKIENGSIDLAITNVPFITGWNVIDKTGDKDLSKKFKDIHDFCIAKNIRKLREGGIGIFITSSGTLDNSAKLRAWVTNEGNSDVVGAFRLHNETFGGTGATSDIIVVRKRVNGKKSAHAIDVSEVSGVRTAEYDTGETKKVKVDGHKQEVPVVDVVTMDYNRYFVEHPEHMAGEMHFGFEKGDTYHAKSKALYPVKGMNQEAMLSAWAQSFSDMDFDAAPSNKNEYETTYDTVGNEVKVGSMVIDDRGRLCVNTGGLARPLMSARKNKQDTRTDDELISMFNSKKIKGRTRQQCLKDYNGIKKALADVLEYQTSHEDNEGLEPLLSRLNATFDSFVSRYGNLHKNNQLAWLRNDVDYPGILALERYEERGDESGNRIKKFGKTDIFSRRVVEKETIPQPKNVKDGIITSLYISGRVDVGYISEQLGISDKQVREEIVSSGLGFENPVSREMEVSYEYLSGNVREKLRQATANNTDGKYDANIKALEKVVPMNIPAHLIEFALGSSWIEPKLYEDYVKERTGVDVNLTNVGGTWFMKTSGSESNTEQNRSQGVYSEELKKTVFGHEILEAAITNRSISVSRTYKRSDGTYETVTDRDATQAVAAKVDEFRIDFKDWARAKMQGDMEMSARMETVYNDRFNNSVPHSIPDEFIPKHFGGQVTEMGGRPFSLRPHQAKAVIRGTTQSQLLAHEVGTGKTFTLISTAMEMRRLGTARKPMIVVQNATVGQFVESAKALYPNAKVLTLEDADRNAQGRKDFYAKIRYNDWDMIVISQSVLDMIPDSEERQIRFIQDKIAEKMLVLQQMAEQDPDGSSWITKQAEKEISDLENDLAKITESLESKRKEKSEKDMKKEAQTRHNAEVRAMEMLDRTTDDVENFDQMGIDALLVDEAHEYKHLGFATAMQRGVKGVDPSYSKKAQGLYLKTQAVMERNRGRNVIFATGTPISNTAAEIWTFMRYLMPEDEMRDYGIYYFDDFVRNFGNLQQMLEFATNGKFKENNRFAGYVNLPELVRIWSTVTDTVLTREAEDVSDKIPDMEGGKAQDIYLPQTKALRSVMLYVKSELDRYDKMTGKEKKANSHIPLTMYGIAKAAAVDARLVYSDAADEPQSKTNEAVRQTLRSLEETSDYKGTVAIFADNYQNKQSGFNLYEDIRRKLIEQGVPAEQIVVMKSGMTVKKKLEIFDKVNAGEVRVILGSTYTLGTGVNIQERLHTLIHLDAPNRPMDYTQRNGRILRQGNLHKDMGLPVRVLRFGVEDSLDVTAYQRLKTKGAIADSIMNGSKMMENSMETRSLEEDEDVFGDITAQLSGSEYAMLKNQAEKEVRKLNSKLKQWEADQTYIHNQIPRLKGQIRESEKRQKTAQENLDVVRRIFPNGTFKTITIGKQTFSDLESMNKLFTEHNKSVMDISDQIRDNKISGPQTRKLTIDIDGLKFEVTTVIDKEMGNNGGNLFSKASRKITYSCPELPGVEDVPVSGARLKGAVEDIVSNLITGKDYAEMVDVTQSSIDRNQTELKQIEQRKDKEFEYYDELAEAKERLEEYTEKMKAELAEKEAKYADMDADVEVATDITLSEEDSEETEDEELLRDGYGAYSDAEVSMENDPWSKAWGESIRTKRQQRQFAERERERMRERAKSLSSILGLDIEVIEDSSTLKGKKQRAKGWYDTKTGKITVVVSNHNSASDMEATILHEAVAHHGLRQLLGKHFDEFLDKVYEAAENGIKEQIDLLASRNGWDRRVATEEYLAGLAERTDFDRAEERVGGWFDKIKRLFLDMLFKAGFKHISPGSIGDNELRYILWRSYQNLANPGRYRAFEWEAEDVAMQYKLQVGEYDATSNNAITAADSDIRFRDGDFTPRDRALAALQYEHMLSRGSWQFREATQDSMLGLKTLYESILGSNLHIENVAGYENAYLYENRMSSANNGEQHQYFSRFMKPLLESIHKLCGSKELDRRILTDYMMAKHGLERNEYMRNEAAANGEDTKRDFAGLCGLTGESDWQVAETVAQQMVDDYEADHNTAELWDNVQKATNATLEKIYLSGLISEDTYNKVLGMYDFYIPLRGWDETTSDEVYGYLTSKDGPLMGSVFKTAEGRDSKADDPIATIAMMADDAIRQGNRNIMKQRFLNFVHGNPSDLVSVNEMWLQHNDVTDEWEPVFADLQPNMTHAEVESEIAKFEAKMEALRTAEPDKYKKGGDARNIPYKVVRGNLNEHQVLVKRNGRTYVITINGNPRAAQALNGLTNPNVEMGDVIGNMLKLGEYVNRHLSAFYTTRNPDFVVSNFMRDMLYSNCMTWVKENPRYALRFHKNFGKVNPLTLRRLLSKWENDNLSDSNYLEKMFKEFMLNGGETGYTSVKDIEGHKRTIASELKKQGSTGRKAWNALGMQLDLLNRSAENCARFAAFLTSREMGRTLDRSIYDAKEVSVNFNKKGSGGKFVNATGQKFLGKLGSYLGGGGRIAYVFWNAGVQGMTNFGRAGVRNPKKALTGAAALFALGSVIPLLAQLFGGGDGDDDDKNAYYNLPEYVRRSNICFKAGDQWITIPLPIEYRAIYGMGELSMGVISGNERYSNAELTRQMASQVSQILPLDMLEGGGGLSPLIPSAFKPMTEAYVMNKGWTGLPIAKDSPFNKNEPEWTKAYQSADQHLVGFAKWLNETTGGDDYKKGAIDINPAKLEYLLNGTFGGMMTFPMKIKKSGETAFGDRDFEWRNTPLLNIVVKSGDERTANRKLQNEYFKYKSEAEETDRLKKKYENASDGGILAYAEKVDFLYNSNEYLRYEIFKEFEPDINAIQDEIKEETDPEAKKELQTELYATMRELVDALHEVGK